MPTASQSHLEQLLQRCGIPAEYQDYRKEPVLLSLEARAGVLECLGFSAREDDAASALQQLETQVVARLLPAIVVVRQAQPVRFALNANTGSIPGQQLVLELEDGSCWDVDCHPAATATAESQAGNLVQLDLADELPLGYHTLRLQSAQGELLASMSLVVAPQQCFQPEPMASGGKTFGISLQLYTLRSARNWGMGDFTDLTELVTAAAAAGADLVGLNPLHALFPANPLHFSPYSPSNRAFLNVLYIDVEAVPEYADCEPVRQQVAAADFQQRLEQLRQRELVDYAGVSACKMPLLEQLFAAFVENHLQQQTPRAADFERYVVQQGEALYRHALYDALHEHFFRRDMQLWGWPVWPEGFRTPQSDDIAGFAAQHADRVQFFQYLQWCARQQLDEAQQAARKAGMAVGVYLDFAVGIDTAGSEAWSNQSLFCLSASAGAPPDALARSGQDWGFPPLNPVALRDTAYQLFVTNLRANMAMAGAVRYDHAVSLLRLWWVPHGAGAARGAYVNYQLEELLAVLALESQRNRCLIIGEDLGTVPDELTAEMHANHVYSYRVFPFETDNDTGEYFAPDEYPAEALATVSTHDLPTLCSWWEGSDLDLRESLGLLGNAATAAAMRRGRIDEKQHMIDALTAHGVWQGATDAAAITAMSEALNLAIHRYLAISGAKVLVVQLEDLLAMHDPVNVPGTFNDYPNWQRKLSQPIEGLFERDFVCEFCREVAAAQRAGYPGNA